MRKEKENIWNLDISQDIILWVIIKDDEEIERKKI